jgi:1-acyl-sn-glycerol-3-phosphate acyltransferase
MESEVKIPWGVRLFRSVARPFFRMLFRILCHVQIEGFENLPREGGYLVSANHVSIYDPPLVVAFWPKAVEAAGAVDVLERGMQGVLMRLYGGMSVHRGQADRKLLMEMVRRLRAGLPVLMDPEGRRSYVPGMQTAHPGVAYVAAKAGVPVVPVGVMGTESVLDHWKRASRPHLRMIVGEPVHLPPVNLGSPDQKRQLRSNTEMLMRAIADLLPPEYRGVYG